MKKNVASQSIGAQMVSATDGSAFTSSVTVYVTGDNGTQAIGSVASGACTHEGNGYHSYAPAQAETNYDHVAFTFIGTGAIPGTVEVFTSFPQTGDSFVRLGAPAGVSIAADLVVIDDFLDTEVAAIKAKTDNLPTDPADASDIAASFATVNTKLDTIDDFVDTEVAAIFSRIGAPIGASISADIAAVQADTDNIQTRLPAALVSGRIDASVGAMAANVLTATAINADAITDAKVAADVTIASVTGAVGSVTGAVGSVTGNVGGNVTGSVGSVAAGGITATSFGASAIDAAALATDAGQEIADRILTRAIGGGSDAGRTVRQALAAGRNKWEIVAGTLTVYAEDDSTVLYTAAVTTTAGNPISAVDP